MKEFACMCGSGTVRASSGSGRTWAFKDIPDLPVPDSAHIPTCDHCGEEFIDKETEESIIPLLEQAYTNALAEKFEAAIFALRKAGLSQLDIEREIGLSDGYISKLKAGKNTRRPLASFIILVASNPSILSAVKKLWHAHAPIDLSAWTDVRQWAPAKPSVQRMNWEASATQTPGMGVPEFTFWDGLPQTVGFADAPSGALDAGRG